MAEQMDKTLSCGLMMGHAEDDAGQVRSPLYGTGGDDIESPLRKADFAEADNNAAEAENAGVPALDPLAAWYIQGLTSRPVRFGLIVGATYLLVLFMSVACHAPNSSDSILNVTVAPGFDAWVYEVGHSYGDVITPSFLPWISVAFTWWLHWRWSKNHVIVAKIAAPGASSTIQTHSKTLAKGVIAAQCLLFLCLIVFGLNSTVWNASVWWWPCRLNRLGISADSPEQIWPAFFVIFIPQAICYSPLVAIPISLVFVRPKLLEALNSGKNYCKRLQHGQVDTREQLLREHVQQEELLETVGNKCSAMLSALLVLALILGGVGAYVTWKGTIVANGYEGLTFLNRGYFWGYMLGGPACCLASFLIFGSVVVELVQINELQENIEKAAQEQLGKQTDIGLNYLEVNMYLSKRRLEVKIMGLVISKAVVATYSSTLFLAAGSALVSSFLGSS